MKKVGIVTHYFNSTNYGGVLQSYALCKYLNNQKVPCEQVCYNSQTTKRSIIKRIMGLFKKIIHSFFDVFHFESYKRVKERKKAFLDFRNSIPHSSIVYTEKSIGYANSEYSSFVTGSDQVWNPNVFGRCYSLLFSNRPKFSYAASMAVDKIDSSTFDIYKTALSGYEMISVRERKAQQLLSFDKSSKLVLDPVFLISKREWEKIASSRIIAEKYCFTYFLGDSISSRKEVEKFSNSSGLKIVNIPYLMNTYRKCDSKYGDYRLSNIGPKDFLSLIVNAECVFTDSFHAICFSFIFKKDFYVFKRESKSDMNTRITDILFTLGLEERYISKIQDFCKIDYSGPRPIFDKVHKETSCFLKELVISLKNKCDE